MDDQQSLSSKFWEWLSGLLPRSLVLKCAERLLWYAYEDLETGQATEYMDIVHTGYRNWRRSARVPQEAPDA